MGITETEKRRLYAESVAQSNRAGGKSNPMSPMSGMRTPQTTMGASFGRNTATPGMFSTLTAGQSKMKSYW